jgi:hypothetical protein
MIPTKVAAKNIDSLNRSAVSAAAYENGSVGYFSGKSSTAGESEVWTMTAPVTAHLYDLWMAAQPEVVLTAAKYKGLDPDVRNFRNEIGEIFSVFKPEVGDLITLSADAVAGSINNYVVATDTAQKLTWAAAAVSGLSLKLIETTYISLATGAINSQRVTTYLFEVCAVR